MIISSSTSLRAVVDQLTREEHLNPDTAAEISETVSTLATEKSNPWYIQAIIGLAAWLAAVPFIGFLSSISALESATSMMVLGSFFCIIAVGSQYIIRKSLFVAQLALAFSLAGQILLIGGIGWATDNLRMTALAVIILELILIAVYPDSLHRFLSTIVIPAAILVLLFDLEIQEAIHVLIIALGVGAVAIWENESYLAANVPENLYRPLGYGLVVSLLYVLILSIVNVFGTSLVEVNYWWVSSIGLLLILLALEYFILTSAQLGASRTIIGLVIIGTIIVFLPTLQAPGIVAAVLVLALGFHRGNVLLMGLATVFFALFLIIFYYNLALTLLTKSLILMATGLALFGLRFLLMKWLETTEVNV